MSSAQRVPLQDAVPVPVSLSALRRLYSRHRADIAAGSSGHLESAPPELDSLDRLMAASEQHLADMQHCIQWWVPESLCDGISFKVPSVIMVASVGRYYH